MPSRYENSLVGINDHDKYREIMRKRGVRFIRQYHTEILHHPTAEELSELDYVTEVWRVGQRLWKLAEQYYGDPTLHWLISLVNQKHEFDLKQGDVVYIFLPLERLLSMVMQ